VEVVSGFKDAERDVGRLMAPRYTKFAADLKQLIETVSELENQTWQLRGRVADAREDLQERAGRYGDYSPACGALTRAHDSIENAHDIASSLKEGLGPLRAEAAGNGPTAEPAEQEPDRSAAAAEPDGTSKPDLRVVGRTAPATPRGTAEPAIPPAIDVPTPEPEPAPEPGQAAETSVRRVPLLSDIAAGELTMTDAENARDYLELPAELVRGQDVYLLRVKGDSMTGEDGVLEGDYVIVDPGSSWNNGDMVVVFVEGEGATLKRIWHDGTSIYLQPSNPSHEPITLGPDKDPRIQGKVIGVVKGHISAARRRR
jgi:SOS-response transcriptional repressor LexA